MVQFFLGKLLGVHCSNAKPKKMQNTIVTQVKTSPEVQKVYNFLVPTFFFYSVTEREVYVLLGV